MFSFASILHHHLRLLRRAQHPILPPILPARPAARSDLTQPPVHQPREGKLREFRQLYLLFVAPSPASLALADLRIWLYLTYIGPAEHSRYSIARLARRMSRRCLLSQL
eukprot:759745-Hanusia_phi.AAC.4